MKYINKYIENKVNDILDNLIYLKDDGFIFKVGKVDFGYNGIVINKDLPLSMSTIPDQYIFSWNSIKDDLIPTLILLDEQIGINSISFNRKNFRGNVDVDLDEVINDKIDYPILISVTISLKG